MVHYNPDPHITGQYNSLYTLNNSGFFIAQLALPLRIKTLILLLQSDFGQGLYFQPGHDGGDDEAPWANTMSEVEVYLWTYESLMSN